MNIGNKLIHMGINRQVYLLPLFTWYNEKIKINRTYCLAHYRTYLHGTHEMDGGAYTYENTEPENNIDN